MPKRSTLRRITERFLAFAGLSLLIIPWLAAVASAFGLFSFLTDAHGIAQRDDTRQSLNFLMLTYVVGGLAALAGAITIAFCLDGFEYRPRWMFWVLLVVGLIWIPLWGGGTMIGLALLLYVGFNYRRFGEP